LVLKDKKTSTGGINKTVILLKGLGEKKIYFIPNLSHLYSISDPNRNYTVDVINQVIYNAIQGDRYAQSKLYHLFAPGMFVVCQRYAQSKEDAEDILQDGFIKIFQNLQQYRSNGSFEGWVRKIMINCALQKYRSQTHLHIISTGENYENSYFFYEDITSRIEVKELINLVQQLPTAYRMVFNLFVFEGMKHKEIALKLGITEGTSKSNLFDARAILQKAVTRSRGIAKINAK